MSERVTRKRVTWREVFLRKGTSQRWSHKEGLKLDPGYDRKEASRKNAVYKAGEADPLCSANEARVGLAPPWERNKEGRE